MVTPTPVDSTTNLYQPIDELETPAVLVDLDAMERNMVDFAAFAHEHDVSMRSHVKTHKIPDLAHRQHHLTGGGIVCQTLSEVEVMAQNGIDDIYLSYTVVEESKLNRLAWLSEKLESFATTVDGRGNIDPLQEAAARHDATVTAILEIDLGYNRTGVDSPDRAVELAEYIEGLPNLEFGGVMCFEAHVKPLANSRADLEHLCGEAMDELASVVEIIREAEIGVPEVKVGGTATSKFSGTHPVVTEINPGMYLFNDTGELDVRSFELDKSDCAVTVLSTTISKPTDDRIVVNAGSKSISMDADRQPIAKSRDDLTYYRSSEEHGWVQVDDEANIEVGDRVEWIVPHVCTTINLHDTLIGVRDDEVREVWNVQARGKVK